MTKYNIQRRDTTKYINSDSRRVRDESYDPLYKGQAWNQIISTVYFFSMLKKVRTHLGKQIQHAFQCTSLHMRQVAFFHP